MYLFTLHHERLLYVTINSFLYFKVLVISLTRLHVRTKLLFTCDLGNVFVSLKEIQTLEDYSEKYQRQLKKWIGGMLFYSSLLYLATLLVVYLWYLPEQLMGQLILASLFVLFPFL